MKKILGLLVISSAMVFATSCKKDTGNIGSKNGLPNDGIQTVIPAVQISVNELTNGKLTEEVLLDILGEKLVITAPDSANLVKTNKAKIKVLSEINNKELTENQELTVNMQVEVEQYISSKSVEHTIDRIASTFITTSVNISILSEANKYAAEIIGSIDPITPVVGMNITSDTYVSNLKVHIDGTEHSLADDVYQLYDSLVDYSTPGDYAVQIHIGKKNKREKDIYIPVRVNEHKVQTRTELEQYFDLAWTNSIRCKETFDYPKMLFIPSSYIDTNNNNQLTKIEKVGFNGCKQINNRNILGIEHIVVAKGIETIETGAFYTNLVSNSSLVRVDLPEGLKQIDDDFLHGHNKLGLLNLPTSGNDQTLMIKKHALRGLNGLTHVIVKEMPKLEAINDSHVHGGTTTEYNSDNFRVFSGIGKTQSGELLKTKILLPFEYKLNINDFSDTVKGSYLEYMNIIAGLHADNLEYYSRLNRTVLYKYYRINGTV